MGKTLDVILWGSIRKGDEIVVATSEERISTRVKGLFSPRGMSEMRDAGRWDDTDIAHRASGLRYRPRIWTTSSQELHYAW